MALVAAVVLVVELAEVAAVALVAEEMEKADAIPVKSHESVEDRWSKRRWRKFLHHYQESATPLVPLEPHHLVAEAKSCTIRSVSNIMTIIHCFLICL